MMLSDDWSRMLADTIEIYGDNPGTIVILRGTATLSGQTARVAASSSGGRLDSGQAREARGGCVVLGGTALDIAPDDRFAYGGRLYRVKYVHPNRRPRTLAEADVVE
jgi:hypothetical protein